MADADVKKSWYGLRAISGKEAKGKEGLDAASNNTDLGLYVEQVLIPTQKVFTSRNGKKVIKEKNLFPGYVFVQAQLTGEVQYELRNTTNVIDFLRGRAKNSDPMPLREAEVNRMLGIADETVSTVDETVENYLVGEPVKVTAGPFLGFSGVIKEVNSERRKIKVEVKIFGRGTDLELEYSQGGRAYAAMLCYGLEVT